MDTNKVESALDIIQLNIVKYIKEYNGNDKKEFSRELRKLVNEREKIYNLDEKSIEKAYNLYLKQLKKEK